MKLKDLAAKRDNSGIDGNPVITDAELKEMKEKLLEFADYLKYQNLMIGALRFEAESIEHVLDARKMK